MLSRLLMYFFFVGSHWWHKLLRLFRIMRWVLIWSIRFQVLSHVAVLLNVGVLTASILVFCLSGWFLSLRFGFYKLFRLLILRLLGLLCRRLVKCSHRLLRLRSFNLLTRNFICTRYVSSHPLMFRVLFLGVNKFEVGCDLFLTLWAWSVLRTFFEIHDIFVQLKYSNQ
jgi:hypothetical protein